MIDIIGEHISKYAEEMHNNGEILLNADRPAGKIDKETPKEIAENFKTVMNSAHYIHRNMYKIQALAEILKEYGRTSQVSYD